MRGREYLSDLSPERNLLNVSSSFFFLPLSITCIHFDSVDWCSSLSHFSKKKCNASQLQNSCTTINGTLPKFTSELDLKRKMNCSFTDNNKRYWTALRYEKVYYRVSLMRVSPGFPGSLSLQRDPGNEVGRLSLPVVVMGTIMIAHI